MSDRPLTPSMRALYERLQAGPLVTEGFSPSNMHATLTGYGRVHRKVYRALEGRGLITVEHQKEQKRLRLSLKDNDSW